MRELMRRMGIQIEAAAAARGVPVSVTGGQQSARLLSFRLVKPADVPLERVLRLGEELALALGVETARMERGRGYIVLQIPSPKFVPVRLKEIPHRRGLTVPLGRDGWHKPVYLNLASPQAAHVLLVGATGTGKSELMRSMICGLAKQNRPADAELLLVDPKGGRAFSDFDTLTHLAHPVITEPSEALATLQWLVGEMEKRDRKGYSRPELVVVCDEVIDLIQLGGDRLEEALQRLTTRGRTAGIHLVLATQHATAEVLGGSVIKANLTARIVGKVMDAAASALATGTAGLEAHRLMGRGDLLAVIGARAVRFQGAIIGGEEISELPLGASPRRLPLDAVELIAAKDSESLSDLVELALRIRPMWEEGASLNAMQREMFGRTGGGYYDRIKAAVEWLEGNGDQ